MQKVQSPLLSRSGLSRSQVESSRRRHGANRFTRRERRGFFRQFLSNFGDPIIKILLVALALNLLVSLRERSFVEPLGIGAAVLLATLVSTLSEYGSRIGLRPAAGGGVAADLPGPAAGGPAGAAHHRRGGGRPGTAAGRGEDPRRRDFDFRPPAGGSVPGQRGERRGGKTARRLGCAVPLVAGHGQPAVPGHRRRRRAGRPAGVPGWATGPSTAPWPWNCRRNPRTAP